MKNLGKKNWGTALLIIANVLLGVAVVAIFLAYMSDYQKKSNEQNLNDISNINQSAANISSEFFASQERKLDDILKYLERHKLTLNELLVYLDDTNAETKTSYQLVGKDYKGYIIQKNADGGFGTVDYSNASYLTMQKIFDGAGNESGRISFSPEFNDKLTGLRSFARYTYVSAADENGVLQNYTLMAISESAYFNDLINLEGGFDGLSTILINSDGEYILSNSHFKSDNFFQYIYLYNGLSLDEKNQLKADFLATRAGTLEYRNAQQKESVFAYTNIHDTDWFSITCVPISSFHNAGFNLSFTIVLTIILIILMVMDFLWLSALNKRLKLSANVADAANEAKTDFLSRMSHDIRTPINVITGMTELALQENNPSETDEYLVNIRSSGKYLLSLVNDILDMNKVASGKMTLHADAYCYEDFRNNITAVIQPMCVEKDINFKMSYSGKQTSILTDSLRLNQIFLNLLSNAVKFTPNHGHVSLDVCTTEIASDRVSVKFVVADDGIGMTKEFQKTMFNAFSQEERNETKEITGTGLGLTIVENLVTLMNGTISVESQEGEGTRFTVIIEADTVDIKKTPDAFADEHASLEGRRVLLCEDNSINAQIIIKLLDKKSVTTQRAENGQVGIDMFLASAEGYYDAILMDVRMPVMNGLEATKKIRAMSERKDAKTVPIIAITANAYDEDVTSCLEAGMNTHLSKPIDPQLIYRTLSKYIGK